LIPINTDENDVAVFYDIDATNSWHSYGIFQAHSNDFVLSVSLSSWSSPNDSYE